MTRNIQSIAAVLALFTACSTGPTPEQKASADKEAANVKAFETIQLAFATGDAKLLDGTVADDMILHNPDPSVKSTGKQAWVDGIAYYRARYPDMAVKIEKIVADGDWVTGVLTVSGTNTGAVEGEPATGRRIEVNSIDVYRFENGMAVENYSLFDLGKFMEQMGAGAEGVVAMEKDHVCNPGCKGDKHNILHGEKGHVCSLDCPEMKKMEEKKG